MRYDSCLQPFRKWTRILDEPGEVKYLYEGRCPASGRLLQLPRTEQAEAIAYSLLEKLQKELPSPEEGKMFGVLLVEGQSGQRGVLQAFSGLLRGEPEHEGWVPPIPGRNAVAWEETRTLALLEQMKQELIQLWDIPARHTIKLLTEEFEQQRAVMRQQHKENKAKRKRQRKFLQETLDGEELEKALALLSWQSQEDKRERQKLLDDYKKKVHPFRQETRPADREIQRIKKERKQVSRRLQEYMHTVYSLTNFAGVEMSLRDLMPDVGIPTGTGECCAPKLLHYAATHQLKPLAMAEFWYGPSMANGRREQGHFYGACVERCQPIMGFLLSGITEASLPAKVETALSIVYEDDDLMVIDKPSGLLSVPGRYLHRQDSVVSRVKNLFPTVEGPITVHRLDQDTSGLLLLAKTSSIHKALSAQFRERDVHKQYEALLHGRLSSSEGRILLPLSSIPDDAPRQRVDTAHGKPCETHYRVIEQTATSTRVRFTPITGRTHQLRVHAAHPDGLNAPIMGDTWYSFSDDATQRLCLHACELVFRHPATGKEMKMVSKVPF